MALPPLTSGIWQSSPRTFALGLQESLKSVLAYVLFGTFIGVGALAHDTGFSLGWALISSALIWAGPAQVILMTSLHSGATVIQAAIAVTLTAIRLMPMVVSLLPMMRTPNTRFYHLILPAHFTAVTYWVEGFRLFPLVPRERRVLFGNGMGTGFVVICLVATVLGYQMAAKLPPLFGAAVLALTPLTFLYSTALNAKQTADKVALVLGIAFYPPIAMFKTGVDILISGLLAGTIAYGVHVWRRRRR